LNLTLRRVRVTIVVVGKQQMYVCIPALVIRHESRIFSAPHYTVICGLSGSTTFYYITSS